MATRGPVAVFLGAGASKPLGYPLTRELLPEILAGLREGRLFQDINSAEENEADRRRLDAALGKLLPGHANVAERELPWITDILSLIDYSVSEGKPLWPGQSPTDLMVIRRLLERALLEILYRPRAKYEPEHIHLLSKLCQWLDHQRERGMGLISTNYDIAVEDELYARSRISQAQTRFDFVISWLDPGMDRMVLQTRPGSGGFQLLKLHGSLNWLRCQCCENIYINTHGTIAHHAFRSEIDEYNTCHCGHAKLQMHIIAPSLFREIRDSSLLEIWKSALLLLKEAQEWIVIGYSFPAEDIAIRSLFTRAYHSHDQPPCIRVVQADRKAEARYRVFFPKCTYEVGGVENLARF